MKNNFKTLIKMNKYLALFFIAYQSNSMSMVSILKNITSISSIRTNPYKVKYSSSTKTKKTTRFFFDEYMNHLEKQGIDFNEFHDKKQINVVSFFKQVAGIAPKYVHLDKEIKFFLEKTVQETISEQETKEVVLLLKEEKMKNFLKELSGQNTENK